jgi:hypothetical protein
MQCNRCVVVTVLDRLTAAVDRRSPARHRISKIERMIGTLVLTPLVLLESLRRTTTDGVPVIGRGQPRAAEAGGRWSRSVRHDEASRAETHRDGRRRTESTAGRMAGNDANHRATTWLIRSLNHVIGVRITAYQPNKSFLINWLQARPETTRRPFDTILDRNSTKSRAIGEQRLRRRSAPKPIS